MKGKIKMLIKLHKIAGSAWFNMSEATQKEFEAGIKFALANLPVNYNGTKKECIQYISDKIDIAVNNAVNNPKLYLGTIVLYNAMIKELL